MAVVAVVLFAILSAVIVMKIMIYFNNRKRANVPLLAGGALPIIGHSFNAFCKRDHLYETAIKKIFEPAFKRGEKAVTLRAGTWEVYVLMDPDDSFLLLNSCLKKDLVYEFFESCLGSEGLITADAPVWKRHRKLLNPAFNQSVLESYVTVFNDRSQQLSYRLAEKAGKGLFDPLPYAKQTILQIVCETIMGLNTEEEDLIKVTGTSFETFTRCMTERITKFWYYNNFLFSLSPLKRNQDAAVKRFNEVTTEIIKMKKLIQIGQEDKAKEFTNTTKSRFKSLLDLLLDLSKDDTLTESEIQGEVNTFIAAAFDTTYHTLCSTLLTLGSYPEVQKKVFEEQQEAFEGSGRSVEKQDLSKMKYLEAVIRETMRLYPVVLGVGRILENNMNFSKYTLPAGSRCFASIYHLCRHPVWGPDVEQFRPERWLDGSLPNITRAFAVFGLGRRSCIGTNYAMMVMKTALSHVVRQYHISGDVTELVQQLDIVITPVSGHHIALELRSNHNKLRL